MKKLKKLIWGIMLGIFIFTINPAFASKNTKITNNADYQPPKDLQMARLFFAGDVLPHLNFDNHALNYGGGEYNYDRFFEGVKDYTNQADFFMLNCEFTAHPDLEPSGYPMFNSNKAIYNSLADIGVDVITTANNHCLDTGLDGLDHTIAAINSYGIDTVGTYKDDKSYLIKEVNGIKVGLLAYTEQINGLEYLLDTPGKKEKVAMIDHDIIRKDIENIIKEGAEFVIIYPHWGVEYSSYPERWQIELAHDMIDWGADMVIGNHPHVIQPRESYTARDGRQGIIYYSLGNFISNQSHAVMDGDYRTEHGLLVDAIIYKGKNDKKAKILNTSYHSTWVETSFDDYGRLNRVFVIDDYISKDIANIPRANLELMKICEDMNYQTMHTTISNN